MLYSPILLPPYMNAPYICEYTSMTEWVQKFELDLNIIHHQLHLSAGKCRQMFRWSHVPQKLCTSPSGQYLSPTSLPEHSGLKTRWTRPDTDRKVSPPLPHPRSGSRRCRSPEGEKRKRWAVPIFPKFYHRAAKKAKGSESFAAHSHKIWEQRANDPFIRCEVTNARLESSQLNIPMLKEPLLLVTGNN